MFCGSSDNYYELNSNPSLELSYIVAPPQMALYMEYSARIYGIYLKYIAPEDIHVYSIDEVFMDVTSYLKTYKMTAHELAMTIIQDVLKKTGITATAGIGTNLYLCKIAMDIIAKHLPADKDGVRIAELDEMSYRRMLWSYQPITDFWRVGRGYAKRLEKLGIHTMGDIARCSIGKCNEYYNEKLLYKEFGVNAELLIDHAWGYEPCTITDIKKYKPKNRSMCAGQVLHCPYEYDKARLVIQEMADTLSLDLFNKQLVTDQIVITVGYDCENIKNNKYTGEVYSDHYGRKIPKKAHGSLNLNIQTSSTKVITNATVELFDKIVNRALLIRRMSITANHVINENSIKTKQFEQLDLFTDYANSERERTAEMTKRQKEKNLQQAILKIQKRFGKNAIVKAMNLQEGATGIMRNSQIGGHKA